MAEVTGANLRSSGLTAIDLVSASLAKTMYMFGRDYYSRFRYLVSPIEENESEYLVGQGGQKRLLATKPFKLDSIKHGAGQIQSELSLSGIQFAERYIQARQFGKISALNKDQNNAWKAKIIKGLQRATVQGLGAEIDNVISRAFSDKIAVVEVPNVTTGTRRIVPKITPTVMKTNYVYRYGDWTTSDAEQFSPDAVHAIHGFFVDRKVSTAVLQLTPTAARILGKTEQGEKLLQAGGVYGNTSLIFVYTPHDVSAGAFINNNSNTAKTYTAGTDRIVVASRKILDNNVDNQRVFFPSNQTMGASNLNGLNDVASGSFEEIEIWPNDLLAAWSIDSVAFGDFLELNMHLQKEDIRFLGALFILSRFGIGSVIKDENKVMLFPIKGKKV